MNKLFIFDLDGVIIDDESAWEQAKAKIYPALFGKKVADKLGSTHGVDLDTTYDRAKHHGATAEKSKFLQTFFDTAEEIYAHAPLTKGLDQLAQELKARSYHLGIVSASPREWVDTAVSRLTFKTDIQTIISLYDLEHLRHKPHPDGYHEAMKQMGGSPESTVILEDSNTGITAAKASGAFTIGLRANLLPGYKQEGADAYAENLGEVIKIIDTLNV